MAFPRWSVGTIKTLERQKRCLSVSRVGTIKTLERQKRCLSVSRVGTTKTLERQKRCLSVPRVGTTKTLERGNDQPGPCFCPIRNMPGGKGWWRLIRGIETLERQIWRSHAGAWERSIKG
jgi:hypothetical protein